MRITAMTLVVCSMLAAPASYAQSSPLSLNFPTKATVDYTTYTATLTMIRGSALSLAGTSDALTIYFTNLATQGCVPAQGQPAQINCRAALAALATIKVYASQLVNDIDTNQAGFVGPTLVIEYLRRSSVDSIAQAQAALSLAYEYNDGFGRATVATTGDYSVDQLSQTLFNQYSILLSHFIPATDPSGIHSSPFYNRAGMEGGLGRDLD